MTFPEVRQVSSSDVWYELLEDYVEFDVEQPEYWTDNDDSALYQDKDGQTVMMASFDFETNQITFYVPFVGIHDQSQ